MTATASIFVMRLLPMGFVFINPRYQAFVESQGLTDAQHFLALQGIIISGHPDRHVMRVKLGAGCNEIDGFLKREHRVPWKERWANALAGRGLISKSCREAQMLRAASAAGLNCPDWIAAGEDDQGKAFLLVRALDNIVDLRVYLRQIAGQSAERRATFQELGNSVARIHAQGFLHGDLYSKHVLIRPADGSIHFLDWQRSQVGSRRSQRHRLNDLAALNATIAEHLASPRERLACFRSYLRSLQTMMELRCDYRKALRTILAETSRLLTRRRIREMRLDPPASQLQHLIWLDGEALCVTRRLQELLEGQIPDYLAQSDPWIRRGEVRINGLPIGIQSCGLLIRRRAIRPVARV